MGLDADYYYTKPWTRAPPYIVGVWLGWFLYVTKESQKRTSKVYPFNSLSISRLFVTIILQRLDNFGDFLDIIICYYHGSHLRIGSLFRRSKSAHNQPGNQLVLWFVTQNGLGYRCSLDSLCLHPRLWWYVII